MWRRLALLSPAISSSSSSSKHYLIQHALKLPALFTTESVKDDVTSLRRPFITFVLGGPGSGKGTQCARIASAFGFAHLSAGDLLREEMSSESTNGELIRNIIKEGKIVPSDITVNLIRKAIKSSTTDRFLIDGFPRSEENRIAFERIVSSLINSIHKSLHYCDKIAHCFSKVRRPDTSAMKLKNQLLFWPI